eukprot:tig00000404_g419.t1
MPLLQESFLSLPDHPAQYVWHCHILSHEDNEMMRPLDILPNKDCPAAANYKEDPLSAFCSPAIARPKPFCSGCTPSHGNDH